MMVVLVRMSMFMFSVEQMMHPLLQFTTHVSVGMSGGFDPGRLNRHSIFVNHQATQIGTPKQIEHHQYCDQQVYEMPQTGKTALIEEAPYRQYYRQYCGIESKIPMLFQNGMDRIGMRDRQGCLEAGIHGHHCAQCSQPQKPIGHSGQLPPFE